MKRKPFILFAILSFVILTSFSTETNLLDRISYFDLSIDQKNEAVQVIAGNTIELKRAPFDIKLDFSAEASVLVNASFDSKTYDMALKNAPMKKLPGYAETGMAENLFNVDKEILINKNAPSLWYYDNAEDHRFNVVSKSDYRTQCTRVIENLYDVNESSQIKVSDVKKDLYLVFIAYKMNDEFEEVELQRKALKITWK